MNIIDVEQRSPEWHEARIGVITGSNFKLARQRIKTGARKGEYTDAAKTYAFKLAIERETWAKAETFDFETFAMKRGSELETEAKEEYRKITGHTISECGIVLSDCGNFGVSPDALIDGCSKGLEIKCPISMEKIRSIFTEEDISEYMDQVNGCMLFCEREEWDVFIYTPQFMNIDKPYLLTTVRRNEKELANLKSDLDEFNDFVLSYKEKIKKAFYSWCNKTR